MQEPVASCSIGAQGLWLRLKMIAHNRERYGYLWEHDKPISKERMAARAGLPLATCLELLTELRSVGVPAVTTDGIYHFPDMVQEAKIREIRRKAGQKGGLVSVENKQKSSKTKAKVKQNTENESENENEDENGGGKGDGLEGADGIPADLSGAREAILAWLSYKRERREKYKPLGLNALWSRLRSIPPDQRKAAIENSMGSNYAGIFESKAKTGGTVNAGDATPSDARKYEKAGY